MTQESELARGLAGRSHLLARLNAELIGPDPCGKVVDDVGGVKVFETFNDFRMPQQVRVSDSETEETLRLDPPSRRYGVAVLFPTREPLEVNNDGEVADPGEAVLGDDFADEVVEPESDAYAVHPVDSDLDADDSDFDLSQANEFRPSVVGLSLLCRVPPGSKVLVTLSGGTYRQVRVTVKGRDGGKDSEKPIWVRRGHRMTESIAADDFTGGLLVRRVADWHDADSIALGYLPSFQVGLEVFDRLRDDNMHLLSFAFVNRTPSQPSQSGTDLACLFQAKLEVAVFEGAEILPYPENRSEVQAADPEIRSFDLLYRDERTYGVGHGCAAGWKGESGVISSVYSESLPTYETPSITPNVTRRDGSRLEVPMAPLAGRVPGDDGISTLSDVIDEYSGWIRERQAELSSLSIQEQEVAEDHLRLCGVAARRMLAGLDLLRNDAKVMRAFRLMNEAMLEQQVRSRRPTRAVSMDSKSKRLFIEGTDQLDPDGPLPAWRAFQIGFILAGIESTAKLDDPDRDTVELIFFPTGGGKTEAYLALAAISMLLRRMRNPDDSGVDVIMRYTLRLLTTQQFLRAAALMCALTCITKTEGDLGGPFTIGIWLGSSTTPNRNEEAKRGLRALTKDPRKENPFLLLRCPHCAAQLGPFRSKGKGFESGLAGYMEHGSTVLFVCPQISCPFSKISSPIPVLVIDEELYRRPPSLLLGTVDKFARLTWMSEPRALFGLGADGSRNAAPPNLIVQDELHLISGPLGSMVGLYESVIEELCTDRRDPLATTRPKIVTSTATIRRYADQVRSLYGREKVLLFPPSGISADDSFFARYARDRSGALDPGRLYVGVFAPALGSGQTTVTRVLASLGQAAKDLPEESRDPWWTSLCFFNSMRELGAGLSLTQSDVPDYLNSIAARSGVAQEERRYLNIVEELTSRLRSDEVPRAIEKLERPYGARGVVDVCLASSIIEVGIDIDRLSLMAIVGQPKSTSQYIQVSGRVGRRPTERPGLVVTIYSASKPRDRSHFERFRSYHQRLYAQVEPTSATPFAPPVLDRALHAVIVAGARQSIDALDSPFPRPKSQFDEFVKVLRNRLEIVDESEEDYFDSVVERRSKEWDRWSPSIWNTYRSYEDVPLLHPSGQWVPAEARGLTWETPTSMRDVDAECRVAITSIYNREGD